MKKADDYVICFLFCPKKVRGTGTAGNNKNRDDFSSLFSFYKVCSNQLPKFFARISIKTRLREGYANAQAFAGVAETGGICKCASVCRRRRDGRGDPSPTLQHSFMQLSKKAKETSVIVLSKLYIAFSHRRRGTALAVDEARSL